MAELLAFWSDDFDADLLKVVPGVRETLGVDADLPLWTHGGTSHGRLNMPSCWNRYDGEFDARFGTTKDVELWLPSEFRTGHDLVECTWLEALRDAWVHSYWLHVDYLEIWNGPVRRSLLDALMCHVRGWRTLTPVRVETLQRRALVHIEEATELLAELVRDTSNDHVVAKPAADTEPPF